MRERSPRLRIETRLTDSGALLRLVPTPGEPLEIELTYDDRTGLREMISGLRSDLRAFKDSFSSLDASSWEQVAEGLQALKTKGNRLALRVFNDRLGDVIELFRQVHPLWRHHQGEPPLLEVDGPLQLCIPFEFLPLFSTEPVGRIEGYASLLEEARAFVGFSLFVKRHLSGSPIPREHVLDNRPKLPVRLFCHAGLHGAVNEIAFFRGRSHVVELRGPWPSEALEEKVFREGLFNFLWDPSCGYDGAVLCTPDQVQHFACHCETEEELSDEAFLELDHDGQTPRYIRVRDLEENLSVLLGRGSQNRPVRPLIFVNACGSAVRDEKQMASFHRFFLRQNGNRGFIGTETRIPDDVASAFSKYFYSQLLKGVSLGEAIHGARWKLLERHRNPLGLLYTVHAAPEIRVHTPAS